MLSPTLFALLLVAALFHASWNALVKIADDRLISMTVVMSAAALLALPFALHFGVPNREAWPFLLASLTVHGFYHWFLIEAYRHGDFGAVYPIARGAAPLMTTLLSAIFLHETPGLLGLIGIVLLASGVMALALGRHGEVPQRRSVLYALAVAAMIALYSLADGMGGRASSNVHGYIAWLFVLDAMPLLGAALWLRKSATLEAMRSHALSGAMAGVLSVGSYWIAIWAMTEAPIALVAALRETSVLFASVIAVIVMKEPLIITRIIAACVVLCGVFMLRLFG